MSWLWQHKTLSGRTRIQIQIQCPHCSPPCWLSFRPGGHLCPCSYYMSISNLSAGKVPRVEVLRRSCFCFCPSPFGSSWLSSPPHHLSLHVSNLGPTASPPWGEPLSRNQSSEIISAVDLRRTYVWKLTVEMIGSFKMVHASGEHWHSARAPDSLSKHTLLEVRDLQARLVNRNFEARKHILA